MNKQAIRLSALVIGGVSAIGLLGAPNAVLASHTQMNNGANGNDTITNYRATLKDLNNSGVRGNAAFTFDKGTDPTLSVQLSAEGAQANKIHPIHIHGKNSPEVAMCPTKSADTNNDGFVSVIEGAPSYGPIKINLTKIQTPFGAPPTLALFTPFAGTAVSSNFPTASANGSLALNATYKFDSSAPAQAALASLSNLEDQHIVVHGAMAPASVDADAFAALGSPVTGSLSANVYDPLLPIACGEIKMTHKPKNVQSMPAPVTPAPASNMNNREAALTEFRASISKLHDDYSTAKSNAVMMHNDGGSRDVYIASIQTARDAYVNHFYEARNLFVDQLNQSGETKVRDSEVSKAESDLSVFSNEFEMSKAEISTNTDSSDNQ